MIKYSFENAERPKIRWPKYSQNLLGCRPNDARYAFLRPGQIQLANFRAGGRIKSLPLSLSLSLSFSLSLLFSLSLSLSLSLFQLLDLRHIQVVNLREEKNHQEWNRLWTKVWNKYIILLYISVIVCKYEYGYCNFLSHTKRLGIQISVAVHKVAARLTLEFLCGSIYYTDTSQ